MRNCESESNPNFFLPWAPGMKRCPFSQIETEANVAIAWHARYTRLHVLPFGGSDLMEQPAFVHEAIFAVDDAILEVESEQRQKQREEEEKLRNEAERLRKLAEKRARGAK